MIYSKSRKIRKYYLSSEYRLFNKFEILIMLFGFIAICTAGIVNSYSNDKRVYTYKNEITPADDMRVYKSVINRVIDENGLNLDVGEEIGYINSLVYTDLKLREVEGYTGVYISNKKDIYGCNYMIDMRDLSHKVIKVVCGGQDGDLGTTEDNYVVDISIVDGMTTINCSGIDV